tara:strand:+ start:1639 stop:2595 length:957 start_codon:yes stop_codon:yes gene_type:complete
MANYKATALKQNYWYKIGGKTVTKAQYNAYKNPVGDGPTKSTNDPDASGRKAEIADARSKNKASKRPTALTEAQTKLKDQGTKLPKKRPPFKKKDFSPHMMYKKGKKAVKANTYEKHLELKKAGYGHTPLKNKYLNRLQTGLTVAGMIPGVGNLADGLNTAVSAGRAGYAKYKGDEEGYKTHRNNAAINAAAMVPGAGLAVGGAKLAAKAAKGTKAVKVAKTLKNATDTTKVANRVASNTGKVVVKKAVKKAAVTGAKKGQEKLVRSSAEKSKTKNIAENRPPKRTKPGSGVLKPKANKNKKPGFKTGLENITSKKVA